jgi:hypothetical protein
LSAGARASSSLGAGIGALLQASLALAFPPYESTDAGTADPWTLEGYAGLVRYERDARKTTVTTPLLDVNLGLPEHLELTGELEYVPAERALGDAAVGLKWVPYSRRLSLGVETLALLPVSSAGGAGVEWSFLATQHWTRVELHVNAGGFYDARPEPVEKGWMASVLGEVEIGLFRPGVELFARQVISERVAVQAGVGWIVTLGPVELRAGAHAGLTDAAPDFVASFWVAGAFALAGGSNEKGGRAQSE